MVGSSAKPLKLADTFRALVVFPLREFSFHQSLPQKVTAVSLDAFSSPITNALPPVGNANTIVGHLATVLLPPTSVIVVVIVTGPVKPYT